MGRGNRQHFVHDAGKREIRRSEFIALEVRERLLLLDGTAGAAKNIQTVFIDKPML